MKNVKKPAGKSKKPVTKKLAEKKSVSKKKTSQSSRRSRLDGLAAFSQVVKENKPLRTKEDRAKFKENLLKKIDESDLKKASEKKIECISDVHIIEEPMEQLEEIESSVVSAPTVTEHKTDLNALMGLLNKFREAEGEDEGATFTVPVNVELPPLEDSPISKSIKTAHAKLKSFERTYATIKAKCIANTRLTKLVLDNFNGDEKELEEALFNEMHFKHKMLMVEKIYAELIRQFNEMPCEQVEIEITDFPVQQLSEEDKTIKENVEKLLKPQYDLKRKMVECGRVGKIQRHY